MALNINYNAGTVSRNGQTYNIKELGIDPKKASESEVKNYLENVDFSKFTSKTTGSDTFTSTTSKTNTTKSPEQLKKELDELKAKEKENKKQIRAAERNIEALIKKASKQAADAVKNQEKLFDEHAKDTKIVISEQLNEYTKANKSGEGMTKEQLSQNIQKELPNVPNLSNALSEIMSATGIVSEIETSVGDLKTLINNGQELQNQITEKQAEYKEAKAKDPMGFSLNGKTYELIVDDGKFDSITDMFGYEGEFDAMRGINADGDDKVSLEEFQKANVKAVDQDGNIFDLSTFGDVSVDLNSFDKNGKYDGLDSKNQKLLGTFTFNINGQAVKGYSTLDNTDWLSNKYGIANEKTGSKKNGLTLDETFSGLMNKANNFEGVAKNLRSSFSLEYKNIQMSAEEANNSDTCDTLSAVSGAKNFFIEMNKKKEEEEKEKNKEKLAA